MQKGNLFAITQLYYSYLPKWQAKRFKGYKNRYIISGGASIVSHSAGNWGCEMLTFAT